MKRWFVVVAAVLAACSGCSGTGVTAARVDEAVGTSFARLYTLRQRELGQDPGRRADGTADCSRNKAGRTDRGAGDDWVCVVNLPYTDGHIEPVNYDVRVQPTGCYTAQGPSQLVGPQQQRRASGGTVTNPLFEFDGCFAVD